MRRPHDAPEQISRTTIPRTIAGWLTGKVVKGRGYGAFRDIILGIVGAFIAGMVMRLFGVQGQAGFMGQHHDRVRRRDHLGGGGPGSRHLRAPRDGRPTRGPPWFLYQKPRTVLFQPFCGLPQEGSVPASAAWCRVVGSMTRPVRGPHRAWRSRERPPRPGPYRRFLTAIETRRRGLRGKGVVPGGPKRCVAAATALHLPLMPFPGLGLDRR